MNVTRKYEVIGIELGMPNSSHIGINPLLNNQDPKYIKAIWASDITRPNIKKTTFFKGEIARLLSLKMGSKFTRTYDKVKGTENFSLISHRKSLDNH